MEGNRGEALLLVSKIWAEIPAQQLLSCVALGRFVVSASLSSVKWD